MTIKDCFAAAASAVPAGGGGGGATGFIYLNPADCTDGRSYGAMDSYNAPGNLSFIDNGGVTEVTFDNNYATAANKGNELRNQSIIWKDTGIKFKDISSIEMHVEHIGEIGNPYSGNKKPSYGFIFGQSYMVPNATVWYPMPEHYVASHIWADNNNINIYRNIVVNNEGTATNGVSFTQHPIGSAFYPINYQDDIGGVPKLTTRDGVIRQHQNSKGVNSTTVGRDASTWLVTNRHWGEDETLKVGIMVGHHAIYKTHLGGEGFRFKIHYKVNEGRI
jgi:hypothetical protein